MKRSSASHGFTLVELSIVLVIIALIVGGVMVGRELVASAKLREVVAQKDRLVTAVQAFKIKYNCLPGDCATATRMWSSAYNGDGDGVVRAMLGYSLGGNSVAGNYYEQLGLLQQLSLAGLVSESYTGGGLGSWSPGVNVPTTQIPGSIAAFGWLGNFNGGSSWLPMTCCSIPTGIYGHSLAIFSANMNMNWNGANISPIVPAIDASAIDRKVDDGYPWTGQVIAPSSNSCSSGTGGGVYSSSALPICLLIFRNLF